MIISTRIHHVRAYWLVALITFASLLFMLNQAQTVKLHAQTVGQAVGTEATVEEDGVVRTEWSRDDAPVTVHRMRLPPPAGLGS
jgi:hypothetical protein